LRGAEKRGGKESSRDEQRDASLRGKAGEGKIGAGGKTKG